MPAPGSRSSIRSASGGDCAPAPTGEAGYPVVVFGGRHADVPITAEMGAPLGQLIARQALASVVDLSELGSNAARRQFMAAFAEALYEANEEPLHLVLDEADLWAPQRPIKGWEGLLGHIEEIVRRGRVRGFIPWLITQRPAVVHKDVLSQADILIAMKLTSSQDREAIGAWIEGQADRQEGKRILADLPRLQRAKAISGRPATGCSIASQFPAIRTFDSSRTPKRGERPATPRTLAEVDLTAITAALAAASTPEPDKPCADDPPRTAPACSSSNEILRPRSSGSQSWNRKIATLVGRLAQIVARSPLARSAQPIRQSPTRSRGRRLPRPTAAAASRVLQPSATASGGDVHAAPPGSC